MNENTDSAGCNNPTFLLLEEDDDVLYALTWRLRLLGFRVLVAVSMIDAREWLSAAYIHAYLVLVDLVGKSTEEALEVGRKLRTLAKCDGHTPLVVMAEKYSRDVDGTEVNVEDNDWIFYLGEESGQLHNLIERLTFKRAA